MAIASSGLFMTPLNDIGILTNISTLTDRSESTGSSTELYTKVAFNRDTAFSLLVTCFLQVAYHGLFLDIKAIEANQHESCRNFML